MKTTDDRPVWLMDSRIVKLCITAFTLFHMQLPASESPQAQSGLNETGVQDPAGEHIRSGRELFQRGLFLEACNKFTAARKLKPDDNEALLLAGLAAYWARKPERALDAWNALLDNTRRNTSEEFKVQQYRIMALSALEEWEAVEQAVSRLYELHRVLKLPVALTNHGFIREHIYQGHFRAGVWEILDEPPAAIELWAFPITDLAATVDSSKNPRSLSVVSDPHTDGSTDYILLEKNGGRHRVYKHWPKKPEYLEVRALVLLVLDGLLRPLEDTLEPVVSKMLSISARLRDVSFDVTHLARASLNAPQMAEKYLQELTVSNPTAQNDATELLNLLSSASSGQVDTLFKELTTIGARKPYLEFTLLTAMNTRGQKMSDELLRVFSTSSDFMVRQTALFIAARQGDRQGLATLFSEMTKTDAIGCCILYGSLEELLGEELESPPQSDQMNGNAIQEWKRKAESWWDAHSGELTFVKDPKPGQVFWMIKKK